MLLELKNIYKSYYQGKMEFPVLKNINFSVEEGEYVAIMGPSGSGKSTLMNIIGCLDKPTQGEYYLEGVDVSKCNDRQLSVVRNKSVGFVFQTYNLMPRQNSMDNVGLPLQYAKVPKKKRKEMCQKALSLVGLEDKLYQKPTQLSGGQKQRVAIARAMVNEPKIILADEPTGALDSKSGAQIMELFDKLHKDGATIIMITHSNEIAAFADRVIKIIDGELIDESVAETPDDISDATTGAVSEDTSEDTSNEIVTDIVGQEVQEYE